MLSHPDYMNNKYFKYLIFGDQTPNKYSETKFQTYTMMCELKNTSCDSKYLLFGVQLLKLSHPDNNSKKYLKKNSILKQHFQLTKIKKIKKKSEELKTK